MANNILAAAARQLDLLAAGTEAVRILKEEPDTAEGLAVARQVRICLMEHFLWRSTRLIGKMPHHTGVLALIGTMTVTELLDTMEHKSQAQAVRRRRQAQAVAETLHVDVSGDRAGEGLKDCSAHRQRAEC